MLNSSDYGWIDSGVNLLDPRINNTDVLKRSAEHGVKHILAIGSTIEESIKALELKETLKNLGSTHKSSRSENNISDLDNLPIIETTAGIHPHYADSANQQSFVKLKSLCIENNIRVIGECGLDFNRNFSSSKNQLYAFEAQLELAAELGIGVYLHEREAFSEQIHLLEKYAANIPFKVAHCFTGNTQQMKTYLELGCSIGITGWICDNKRGQDLQLAVKELPFEKMLLETDAPYLFPKTARPRKSVNEPSYILHIANTVADIIGCEVELVKRHTFNNAYELFFA